MDPIGSTAQPGGREEGKGKRKERREGAEGKSARGMLDTLVGCAPLSPFVRSLLV